MKTIRICFYEFEELSDNAMKTAVENHKQEVFDAEFEDRRKQIVDDVVADFEKNGIHGFTSENFEFNKKQKVKPFDSIELKVDGKFFKDTRFYAVDNIENIEELSFSVMVSYDGKEKDGVRVSRIKNPGEPEMFAMESYLCGWIGATIKNIDTRVGYASEDVQKYWNVRYYLSQQKDRYYHKDGSDATEAEMSLLINNDFKINKHDK